MKKIFYNFAFCWFIGLAFISGNVQQVSAQTMTVAPHMIVLNSAGPDIKTLYSGPLEGSIVNFSVKLYFDGVEVADAYSFTYCYIDNIFKAMFHRQSISFNTAGIFEATIDGEYTTLEANGNTITNYINPPKWDWVEIKIPGGNGQH